MACDLTGSDVSIMPGIECCHDGPDKLRDLATSTNVPGIQVYPVNNLPHASGSQGRDAIDASQNRDESVQLPAPDLDTPRHADYERSVPRLHPTAKTKFSIMNAGLHCSSPHLLLQLVLRTRSTMRQREQPTRMKMELANGMSHLSRLAFRHLLMR